MTGGRTGRAGVEGGPSGTGRSRALRDGHSPYHRHMVTYLRRLARRPNAVAATNLWSWLTMVLVIASVVSLALFPDAWRLAGLVVLGISLLAFWAAATLNRMAIGV